jgi:glucose-1-phosphate thymidylyltransferase
MVVGYKREQVQDYFVSGQEFGVQISYITQEQQLGTAHALKQARNAADDKFLVVSGDNIIDAQTITPLINAEANTILVKAAEEISKYGVVTVRDGHVESIEEKPKERMGNLANTGIYVFTGDIFDFIGEEIALSQVLQKMIAGGHFVAARKTDSTWLDVVYPWDILRLNDVVMSKIPSSLGGTIEAGCNIKGTVSIGEGSIIRSGCYIVGPVIIGENCEVGPGVCILPSTSIGSNVVVSPFTLIRNCSIGNDVSIGPNSSLQDSIIASGTSFGAHLTARSGEATILIENEYHRVKMGAIVGSYCEVGNDVAIEPGIVVGNHCRVKTMRVVAENMQDGTVAV